MIIFKLISSGFKKNLESGCSNFYLEGQIKKIYYIKKKITSSRGSFDVFFLNIMNMLIMLSEFQLLLKILLFISLG